jgi:hypothetical protein
MRQVYFRALVSAKALSAAANAAAHNANKSNFFSFALVREIEISPGKVCRQD